MLTSKESAKKHKIHTFKKVIHEYFGKRIKKFLLQSGALMFTMWSLSSAYSQTITYFLASELHRIIGYWIVFFLWLCLTIILACCQIHNCCCYHSKHTATTATAVTEAKSRV